MGKIMKNLLSLTLALLLTVSLAAGNLMSVSAEDEGTDLEEATEEVVEDETSEDDGEDAVPEAEEETSELAEEETSSEDEEESPVQVYSVDTDEKDEADEYEVFTYDEMPDAENGEINLTEDVELDETYVVDGETLTINLNGFTVTLAEGVDGSVIEVTGGANVTINGKGKDETNGTITGGDGHRINGNSRREGGGLYVDSSTIVLNGVTIKDNHTIGRMGGGIATEDSTVTITDCLIDDNSTENNNYAHGGGIYVANCTFKMTGTTVSNNAAYNGGGVYIDDCLEATIDECTITNNEGYNRSGLYITTDNTSSSDVAYHTTVSNSTISYNVSDSSNGGGATVTNNASATFDTVTFEENKTTLTGNYGYGGGLFIADNSLTPTEVTNCKFINNEAHYGGAIAKYISNTNVTVKNCTMSGNKARDGGAIIATFGTDATETAYISIKDCEISENAASRWGGAIAVIGERADIENTVMVGNSADEGGALYLQEYSEWNNAGTGVAYMEGTYATMEGSTIVHNSATQYGGGIANESGFLYALDEGNIICNNTAKLAGDDVVDRGKHTRVSLGTDNEGHRPNDEGYDENMAEECTALLLDAGKMNQTYEADKKGNTINGWYNDDEDNRYADKDKHNLTAYTGYPDIEEETYLVAAYNEYEVVFETDVKGILDGTTKEMVVGGSTVSAVPDAIANEGYEFDYWLGSDGKAYTSDAILELEIFEDMTFTAIYKTADMNQVVFLPGDHGTLSYNDTDLEGGIGFSVKNGSSVEAVPEVKPEEGYTFEYWLGQTYVGDLISDNDEITAEDEQTPADIQTYSTEDILILSAEDGTYTSEEILEKIINENWVFTAIYSTEDSDEAIEGQNLDDGNDDSDLSLDKDVDADYVNDEFDGEVEGLFAEEAEESDSVKTGDSTSMLVYIAGLGLSIAGLSAFYARRKRNYNG